MTALLEHFDREFDFVNNYALKCSILLPSHYSKIIQLGIIPAWRVGTLSALTTLFYQSQPCNGYVSSFIYKCQNEFPAYNVQIIQFLSTHETNFNLVYQICGDI